MPNRSLDEIQFGIESYKWCIQAMSYELSRLMKEEARILRAMNEELLPKSKSDPPPRHCRCWYEKGELVYNPKCPVHAKIGEKYPKKTYENSELLK